MLKNKTNRIFIITIIVIISLLIFIFYSNDGFSNNIKMRFIIFSCGIKNDLVRGLLRDFIVKNVDGPFFKPFFMTYDYLTDSCRKNPDDKLLFNRLLRFSSIEEFIEFNNNIPELKTKLIEMTKSNNTEYRNLAVYVLGGFKGQEVYNSIIRLAEHDPDKSVRHVAISQVGILKRSEAVVFLSRVPLKSVSSEERYAAILALYKRLYHINSPSEYLRIEDDLIEALKDENERVREYALNIIEIYGKKSVIKYIKPLLNDPNENVRKSAMKAIDEIEKRSKENSPEKVEGEE